MKTYRYPSVLSIAGFDGSGGAGIQADMKTVSALGCYATSVLTALPVQNTTGVRSVYPIPATVVSEQIRTILDDVFPDAIKIGMVHTPELVDVIADNLENYPPVPVVFDPVMVATSGHKLIEEQTIAYMVKRLFPLADIITPNLDEAAILAAMPISSVADMYRAGDHIRTSGCRSLLLKGGHLSLPQICSLYFAADGSVQEYYSEKYDTENTHGSGCTLSSAIAAFIARGAALQDAVAQAQEYVRQAILYGKDVRTGKGNGPLNHFFNPQSMIKYELVR